MTTQGSEFISRLDLPYELKRQLGTWFYVELGNWISKHRREVLEAMVEAGILSCTDYLRRHYSIVNYVPSPEDDHRCPHRHNFPASQRVPSQCQLWRGHPGAHRAGHDYDAVQWP